MPSGIYPRTEKHKRNISKALKGKRNFEGHTHTEQYKQKMRLIMKDRKKRDGYINSLETRKKMSEAHKGKHQSQEHIQKRAEKHIKYRTAEEKIKAKIRYRKKFYERNKEKLKILRKKWTKKNPEKMKAHNLAKKYIKIPDNQLCEICNKNKAEYRHHEDYNKPLEVKFLCGSCHKLWHNQKN